MMEEVIGNRQPQQTLEFSVDVVCMVRQDIAIRGWILDYTGTLQVHLKDECGQAIEYSMKRSRRFDVIKVFSLPETMSECGFEILVKRESVNGSNINILLKNEQITKSYTIDLVQFDMEFSPKARLKKVLGKDRWKSNLKQIKKDGIGKFVYDVRMELNPEFTEYEYWIKAHKVKKDEWKRQRKVQFKYDPLISIVIPLYNTPLPFLKEIVDSVCCQSYTNWQLCLADASTSDESEGFLKKHYKHEKRIKYQKLDKNYGISGNTNAALELAEGEFIMLSDHDDILESDALYEIVSVMNRGKEYDILYTDEDKVSFDGKQYFEPHFKPDFNLGLLRSNNYICHITVIRSTLIKQINGFREAFDGAQDYDLILRCIEKSDRICHIPKVLYHWRSHPNSTAVNPESKMYAFEAGRKALQEHYERIGITAKVESLSALGYYKTTFKIENEPLVSIIIPNKDHVEDLVKCLRSIRKTTWSNYEILIVENNSTDPKTFEYYEKICTDFPEHVRVLTWKHSFNYAAINNWAASQAKAEYLLFLNNDVEVITDEWIERLLGFCQQNDVGAVGAKLYYSDETIQHAGVIVGICGVAGHIFCGQSRLSSGYAARTLVSQDMSAVTAACLMVKKSVFQDVSGFDEKFEVAYNDIDLCLKIRKLGYRIMFDPDAELYHYESKSRGLESTPENQKRFQSEVNLFKEKWNDILEKGDPYYNPNLTDTRGDCSLKESYSDYTRKRR